MPTSAQLTSHVRNSVDPLAEEEKILRKTQYFVAQTPSSPDFQDTIDGFFQGRTVIPGPKADPRFGMLEGIDDIRTMKDKYFIRFIDSATTDNADESVGRALFTVMTPSEVKQYEAVMNKLYPLAE